MKSNKKHSRGTLHSHKGGNINKRPQQTRKMTGHTSVNFFRVAAHSVHFTDGAGAKVHPEESSGIPNGTPAVWRVSSMKSSNLLSL